MNTSYECQSCQAQFSGPERTRCLVCDADTIIEIDDLAPDWIPEPDPILYPEQEEHIYT